MHVLFVQLARRGAPFNSSIAALSAWLAQHGHTTALLPYPTESAPAELVPALGASGADAVAISAMTWAWPRVPGLIATVREALPGARVIVGGPHPTLHPDEALAVADAVCTGSGEEPLRAWLEDPGAPHPGLRRRDANDPPSCWTVPDVDALPDWDRALFGDVANDGNRYERAVGVPLSFGGCPYDCSFCGVHGFTRASEDTEHPGVRVRSVERSVAEMERARGVVRTNEGFAAWDAVFPTRRAFAEAFFAEYRRRIGLPFAIHARVEQIKPWLVDAMREGGCDFVVLGIECGDERYRRRILNKGFGNEQAREAFRLLRAAGIQTHASFMIGLPFETAGMLAQSVRLAIELEPSELSVKYFVPERGTPLFGLLERHGLLIDRYVDGVFEATGPTIRLSHATAKDLERASRAFELVTSESRSRPSR